jgi:methylmalonyl-CoA mutase
MLEQLHQMSPDKMQDSLNKIRHAAIQNENLFDVLMTATKYCSLGQLTQSMFEVGGQYRRNM